MRWWDESLFAVNTYEMLQNGKWFTLYFDHLPDLCNTKPPLTNWLQCLSVKMFGYNETAVRLPSALAAGFTIIILFHFILKRFNHLFAWITASILLTSYGFIHFHTARTADADALLTFFLLLTNLIFVKILIDNSNKNILLFFIFLTLSVAVKLYAALLFIPAWLFVLIYYRFLKRFVLNYYFVVGLLVFVCFTTGIIYLREIGAPGYIHQIVFKDAGRLLSVIEKHAHSPLFYLDNFLQIRFSYWFSLLCLGIMLSFFRAEDTLKKVMHICMVLILSYLGIIMLSETKLEWYDMPLYPYMALLAAYPIYLLFEKISYKNPPISNYLKYFLLSLLFLYPYMTMFYKSQSNNIPDGQVPYEIKDIYLYQKQKHGINLNGIKVYNTDWKGSLLFYQYKLTEAQQQIVIISDISQIATHDTVLVSEDTLKNILKNTYNTTIVDRLKNAELHIIHSKK